MTGHLRTTSSLTTGVIWNMAALAFLALAGIALNLAIGRLYGPETLGVFNVAFAVYIFLSQIATFGLQFSALHAVPKVKTHDNNELGAIIYSGLMMCGVIATIIALISAFATPLIAKLFPRIPDLATSWLILAPGLIPFALNKYLLGVINGLQHMRAFAVFQALRFVFILLALAGMVLIGVSGAYLTALLSIAEGFLLLGLLSYVLRTVKRPQSFIIRDHIKTHLRFGSRVFPAGMVVELNTRVDVLMLGALANDRAVGIYTIAALIYEAALQGVVVLRNNISPALARDIHDKRFDHILHFSRRLGVAVTLLAAIGATVAVVLFPIMSELFFKDNGFQEARAPLFWLMMALPFAAAPLCYSLILSQAGRPGWQSIAMSMMLITNIALNAVLIPLYGLVGAGIAMGLSAVIGGVIVVILARIVLGVRLFF
jgi:O-antigen/teichoic acid export membrane protein